MAQSKVGGVFGFLRKSIGSIVYSTSTASLSGIKKQVARSKPTSVRNPRTISQIVQRMKVGPAQLFYAAFEKAAGSVENNPLSHSWQGVPYGPKSRTKFLQLAMTGDPKAYVPKGINFPVPGVYQISQGSLPSLPSGAGTENGDIIITVGDNLTANQITALETYGVQVGDQITCLALNQAENGSYDAMFARVIVGVGSSWELTNDPKELLTDITLVSDGIRNSGGNIACVAFILSRGTSSSTAKRSTAFMSIMPNFASLMSPEAYDAAVDSYITGVTYNSLNSDWYLNQGTSQPFNGQVYAQQLTLSEVVGHASLTGTFLLGRRSEGGSIQNVIFTTNGTSAGNAYAFVEGEWTTGDDYAASRVADAMGNVNIAYAQYSDAIAAQLSGNA